MTTLTAATQPLAGGVWPATVRRGAAAAASGFTFSAGDLWRVVRQRLIMVLFLWTFLIAATIGGTFLWIRFAPSYKTAALVKVESTNSVDPLEQSQQRLDVAGMELLVKDQAVIVTSPDVLGDALTQPEVRQTEWFRGLQALGDAAHDPLDELHDIITASPIPATSILRVEIEGRIPSELPIIVNAVVQKYIGKVNEIQKGRYREEGDRLRAEAERSKKLLDEKNASIDQLRGQLPASVMTSGAANPISERLMTLSALLMELETNKINRKLIYEQLKEMRDPSEMPISAEQQLALNNDPDLFQLRRQVDELRQNLDVVSRTYGPNHRAVKAMAANLDAFEARYGQLQLQKLNEFRNQQLQLAQNDYFAAQEAEQRLREQLESVDAEQRDLDAKVARYVRDLEEREMLKTNYETIVRQKDQLEMSSRREKSVSISSYSQAQAPKRRNNPSWAINVPVGVVLGLIISVGLALLLELSDTSVRTARDLQRHVSLPVLASVPSLDDEEVEIGQIELAAVQAPHSVVAESFRQLRTNLFFSAPIEQQSVLMVTSAGAEEGKTTVSANLAAAIAMSGRRVLLIDANFRRPALQRLFPNLRADGLSNALVGQSKIVDLASSTDVPGLDVVGTGPTPPNPAELLGGSYLRDLIAEARAKYDQVIFDGPPALLVSDGLVLAGAVDGVILVCRFRSTSRGALMRARSQFDAINVRVLGAVLNAVQTTRGGYYRKTYRAFYEYQRETEEPEKRKLPEKEAAPESTAAAETVAEQLEAIDPTAAAEIKAAADEVARENRRAIQGDQTTT
ncbi:MAG: polysaccharide biosynthesis tyrosine autokinase [Phycisphaerae bacterium]